MTDPYNLHRFVEAQNPIYEEVVVELAAGRKTSHWMWFVFPQHKELGRSAMAQRYGIASKEEAQAYWQHSVLGARLRECVDLVLAVKGKTAFQIFGSPDNLKFRSSLTLFSKVAPDEPLFRRALEKYFDGEGDARTLELLRFAGPITICLFLEHGRATERWRGFQDFYRQISTGLDA